VQAVDDAPFVAIGKSPAALGAVAIDLPALVLRTC
jgi:hypothetical protein